MVEHGSILGGGEDGHERREDEGEELHLGWFDLGGRRCEFGTASRMKVWMRGVPSIKSEGFERGGCRGRETLWLGEGEEKRGRKLR